MSGRIRTLKPEWLEDEQLAEAGTFARLLSVALIVLSDDHGRGRANEVVLAAKVFTYESDPIACVREGLARLSRMGFVQLYTIRGQRYYWLRNWAKHQKVDRPGKPRFPGPEEDESQPPPDSSESPRDDGTRDPREPVAPPSRLIDGATDQRPPIDGASARVEEVAIPVPIRSEGDRLRLLAAKVYRDAIEAEGGIFDAVNDRAFWDIGALAEGVAKRVEWTDAEHVLRTWMREWLATGDRRVPAFWKQWCIAKAAGNATSARGRAPGYVQHKAKPGEFSGADFTDDEIPTTAPRVNNGR